MKSTDSSPATNLKTVKALFVEEDEKQWLVMQQILQTSLPEITLIRVASLGQAQRLLKAWRYQEWEMPQLILLDLYVPTAADGWQLLEYLKDTEGFTRLIPVVMLTSSADMAHIAQAYQLGVSAYVLKPVDRAGWQACFEQLRTYWWETVSLPPTRYGL